MDRFRFGRSIRALRRRRGMRQGDLAARSGLSRSVVSRIELGESRRIAWADLVAVAESLDARLELDLRWRGEALDRLIDESHAALVDRLVGIYRDCGWEVAVEASFSVYGERGSIDVFARQPEVQVVAVNEVKASIGEAGATVMGIDRKSRLAPLLARERGWTCLAVARFLVAAADPTSRHRIREHDDLFRAALPARTRACLDWIRRPTRQAPSGIIFLADSRPAGVTTATAMSGRVRSSGRCTAGS
jgi:transcriptional regulator with XRE-family HTH domain